MRSTVRQANHEGVRAVIHAASLHKPHVATHNYQDFIDTNVTGTLILLEEAAAAGTFAQYDQTLTSTPLSFGLDQADRAPSRAGHCIQSRFA
jgi:UDP-glucose 4-epimerase